MTAHSGLDPNLPQRRASDPAASVWVSASAGSGKTKVLTDRVVSLLLRDTSPERILCLTFTKAAAAEMANRVNELLSEWATADDGKLAESLMNFTGSAPETETMIRARRLFAQVLDTPGGLKIQTIHSFCESLLGRFPIEAGLAPHFEVIDERTAAELVASARDRVLVGSQSDPELQAALETVTEHVDELRFGELMLAMGSNRHRLERFIEGHEGTAKAITAIRARLNLKPGDTDESILEAAASEGAFNREELRIAVTALLGSGAKGDRDRGQRIAEWLVCDLAGRVAGFNEYVRAYLKKDGGILATLATKGILNNHPEIEEPLSHEASRIERVQDIRRALVTADATAGLLCLGNALLEAYGDAKRSLARLDYDDLILLAGRLLGRSGIAPWVLFKLDGGLDHILIDEAQDTSPQQWEVIVKLAEEFFSGEGARDAPRTIFAVGDIKQSIFSFQHADPDEFRRMRDFFDERVSNAHKSWRPVELDISFRSTEAVLQAVDRVFAHGAASDGVVEPGSTLRHYAWRSGHAGLVEVWPTVPPREDQDDEPWATPTERRSGDDTQGRLARGLAHRIAGWIGKETLEARGRRMRAGDIMVLVRTRGRFVEALVRALKDLAVPVSGVDRMVLTEQIAVMDLVALGRFLLLPEDDLTLATVLKGPLVGFDDNDLFRLAWDRGEKTLWRRLNEAAASDAQFESAREWLAGLLSRIDFVKPYELFADVLLRPTVADETGRQRMLARLGPDADDPIDEFLNLALAYDRSHTASLEGFLHWVEADDVEVKRDLEQSGRDEVRIMTVHGSKGLQAPVVILPDSVSRPAKSPMILWDGDMPIWPPRVDFRDTVCESILGDAKARRDQEYRRLLYVAMTRAEDRLYVCGAEGKKPPTADCWYSLVREGLTGYAEGATFEFRKPAGEGWRGEGLRLTSEQTEKPRPDKKAEQSIAADAPPEDWMLRPAAHETPPPRPLAPSRDAEAEPPVVSPAGAGNSRRFHRGIIVHRLLEVLPDLPPEARRAAAAQYLARSAHGLDAEAQAQIAAEVMVVLEDPAFGAIFGPGSRAEVPVTGLIRYPDGPAVVSGQIDRLLVTGDSAMIVDFKSNRPPPETMADVADIYWRQMGEYRDIIAQVYPGRPVRCALLWTDGPRLMELTGPRLDRSHARP
jgi:ATP-dependent helicase/nuclease subunit A